MPPDLNLLTTLDVLLAEGSVARAARRLQLSPSAMSRALARLRATTGDPLLVRAGRGLIATPRAIELRDRVSHLVRDAEAVLRPAERIDLKKLTRSFALRVSEGFAESFGPALLAKIAKDAPGVTLRFLPKTDRESSALRNGLVDLETGVIANTTGPEVRTQALFRDRFVGVTRKGHRLSKGKVTMARYAAEQHVVVSRDGVAQGPIDEPLKLLKFERRAAVIVGGFATAIALARASELVASVPERHTNALCADMFSFALPFATPQILVSMMWHPRLDADVAHRWLRGCFRDVCAA